MSFRALSLAAGQPASRSALGGARALALTWRGLWLKLMVLAVVQRHGRRLVKRSRDLPHALEQARRLKAEQALFAVEGIALFWAEREWHQQGSACCFLLNSRLPADTSELLMLHAGLGLSIARRELAALARQPTPEAIEQAVLRFEGLCRRGSRPQFVVPALEALGLVAEHFYPRLTDRIGQVVARDPNLNHLFWHGIGRALYFELRNLVPGPNALRRAVAAIERRAPDEECRASAQAGLAWAIAMVGLSCPGLVARQLLAAEDAGAGRADLRQGLGVAQWIRRQSPAGARAVQALRTFRPDEPELDRRWRSLVEVEDHDDALLSHPALGGGRELLEIFAVGPFETALAGDPGGLAAV